MDGYYNIYKPKGMSSAAAVAALRRITGVKRAGHAGTLDPEAAGVLPVMTGKATRLFDYLTEKEKEYEAVIAFGSSTDTQDATGTVIETGDNWPDRDQLRKAADELTGEIIQVPSMYSAIKVGGKPLYQRARSGETVEVPERRVRIDRIEIVGEEPEHGFRIRVLCGKGTYIRTLCDDLGKKCGCPAHMRSLLRTRSGVFRIQDALTLDAMKDLAEEGRLAEKLMPPDYPLQHLPRADVRPELRKAVINGAKLPVPEGTENIEEGKPVRIYLDGSFYGLAERRGNELKWKVLIAPET